MKFPLWFNAAIHSATLQSPATYTKSIFWEQCFSQSTPTPEFLNLHHNASSKFFLYYLLHLYPSSLEMVKLLFWAFHLSLFYPTCASCPSSLPLSQGLSPPLLSHGEKEDKKKTSSSSSRMRLLIWTWFTSHSSGLFNFLDRHNQSECTSTGEVWGCLPHRKCNSTFCIFSWFCYIPQNFAPFYHQHFLQHKTVVDALMLRQIFASVCYWAFLPWRQPWQCLF